jgi:hypothetical protein
MNFQKVPNENLHMLKVAITANTIIQTESSYTAQKTRTIYAFSVPILTKPLPKISVFGKIEQATVVFYFQGGVGSFDGVLYPVIMRAKYFD